MLSNNYFWFFLSASFFFEFVRQYARSGKCGFNPLFKDISILVTSLMTMAHLVFLILGFWFMPHWWYPLVFAGVDLIGVVSLVALIPERVSILFLYVGVILAPLFEVLAYLGMFEVL